MSPPDSSSSLAPDDGPSATPPSSSSTSAPSSDSAPSDLDLFRAIVTQRSEPALEQLFRRYFARLCEFAFRLSGSHAAAEEIVSDLFYKLFADGPRLGVPENIAAYLFAATSSITSATPPVAPAPKTKRATSTPSLRPTATV